MFRVCSCVRSGHKNTDKAPDDPRPLNEEDADKVAEFDRDLPFPFSLDEFVAHVVDEQGVTVDAGGKVKKKSATESKSHHSILDKLNVLRAEPHGLMADADPAPVQQVFDFGQ